MKLNQSRFLTLTLLSFALTSSLAAQGRPGPRGGPRDARPQPIGTYRSLSGTVSQLNYGPEAEVEGFLLNNNTLVHLPPQASAQIASGVRVGDKVEVSGYDVEGSAEFRTMEAREFQDRTSGKSIKIPQPGTAAPYSGSGQIKQLNYGPDGSINGFVFDNGILATIPPFASSNPSSIRAGITVAYSGYAHNTISGRTVVDVQLLTMNGQQMMFGAPPAGGPRGPVPPPVGPVGVAVPPPPPPNGAAPPPPANGQLPTPPPAGRTDEPPAPPAPPPSLN